MDTSNAAGIGRHSLAVFPKEAEVGEIGDEEKEAENLNTAKSTS